MFPTRLFAGPFLLLFGCSLWSHPSQAMSGQRDVSQVLKLYGQLALERMLPYFKAAGIGYPPQEVVFLVLKKEKQLEVWAKGNAHFRLIRSYKIRKASGTSGPKLREGDNQVPEGIYKIIGLNPNSHYHLSMKLNYPNDFDTYHGRREKRTRLGSNIFIHGKAESVGCLAMGDRTIEELFILVANVKTEVKVVIAPRDPRLQALRPDLALLPEWTPTLYQYISDEFHKYRYRGVGGGTVLEAKGSNELE